MKLSDNRQDCCRSCEKTLMRSVDERMELNDSFAEEHDMTTKCTWTLDHHYDCYETGCGQSFCLIDGTLKENNIKFCAYCGAEIIEEEAGDEEPD